MPKHDTEGQREPQHGDGCMFFVFWVWAFTVLLLLAQCVIWSIMT